MIAPEPISYLHQPDVGAVGTYGFGGDLAIEGLIDVDQLLHVLMG